MTRRPIVYGLDIETDTRTNAIDPQVARVRAVALSCEASDEVFEGDEAELIAELDDRLAALPPGIIATWNGAAFDLPFLADRAAVCGVPIGLRLRFDPRLGARRAALPGHPGAYRAAWYRHGHIDAYRVYRGDAASSPRLPGGLRCLARLAGLRVVEVERDLAVELEREAAHAYASGDARLARVLTERRWPGARSHLDRRVPDTGPWVPPWAEPAPLVEVEVPAFVAVAAGARHGDRFLVGSPSWGAGDGGDDVERVVIRADLAVTGDGEIDVGLAAGAVEAVGVEATRSEDEPAEVAAAGDGDIDDGTADVAEVAAAGPTPGDEEPAEGPVAGATLDGDDGADVTAARPALEAGARADVAAARAVVGEAPALPAFEAAEVGAEAADGVRAADAAGASSLAAATDAPRPEIAEPVAEVERGVAPVPAPTTWVDAVASAPQASAPQASAPQASAPAVGGAAGPDVLAATGARADVDAHDLATPAAAEALEGGRHAEPVLVAAGDVAGPDAPTAEAADPPVPPATEPTPVEAVTLDLTALDVRASDGDDGDQHHPGTLFDQDAPEPAPEAEVA